MSVTREAVEEQIRLLLERVQKPVPDLTPESALFADGLDLDSIEVAELSALFEDEFGADPFTSAEMPQTVGDILAFYEISAA